MAKFAPDRLRWGHMSFDMEFSEMEVVLELIKDRVTNLEFREIPVPGAAAVRIEVKGKEYNHQADLEIFRNYLKPQFNNGPVFYKDEQLINRLTAAGRKPSGITPMLSWLARHGHLVRSGRGWYKLP